MNTSEISKLNLLRVMMNNSDFDEALILVDKLLLDNYLSPFLHATKARLIMLHSEGCQYSLEDAGKCLLSAQEINPNDLEVIEELAHFYDIVMPDSKLASHYATLLLEKIGAMSKDMAEILDDNDANQPQ